MSWLLFPLHIVFQLHIAPLILPNQLHLITTEVLCRINCLFDVTCFAQTTLLYITSCFLIEAVLKTMWWYCWNEFQTNNTVFVARLVFSRIPPTHLLETTTPLWWDPIWSIVSSFGAPNIEKIWTVDMLKWVHRKAMKMIKGLDTSLRGKAEIWNCSVWRREGSKGDLMEAFWYLKGVSIKLERGFHKV